MINGLSYGRKERGERMKDGLKEGLKLLDFFTKIQIEYPELSPDKILIISEETVAKVLTPKRTELIKTIKEKKPKTIGELTKILKRPQEAISRDLTILHNYGILDFVRMGKTKIPKIEKPMLLIPA